MQNRHSQNQGSEDILATAQKYISVVTGLLMVYFLNPVFQTATSPAIETFTLTHYDASMIFIASIAWWLVAAAAIYFITVAITIAAVRILFSKLFIKIFS